jgi:CysZ protein
MPPAPPRGMLGEFIAGATDVWRGFSLLLRRPAWWYLAIIPFVLNLLIFGGLVWLGYSPLHGWAERHFFSDPNAWWSILGGLLELLYWLAICVVIFFLFVPFATIVAAPFNDFLSEKVELDYCGARVDKQSFVRDTWRSIWVGLKTSVRLSLITIGLYALILPLNLIPGFGSVLYTVLSAAITIRFLALQFTAYSMDRRYVDYAGRNGFLKRHRWRTIGLGTMAFCCMWVPGLNALFIPVSAVAGTLLYCDTELP